MLLKVDRDKPSIKVYEMKRVRNYHQLTYENRQT